MEPDDWSDSDEEIDENKLDEPQDLETAKRQVKALQRKLEQAKQDLVYYRQFVSQRLNLAGLADDLQKEEGSASASHVAVPLRDDDSHYFQSYAENGEDHELLHYMCSPDAEARYSLCHDQ